MKVGRSLVFFFFVAAALLFAISLPAHAAPSEQQYSTNTALPDGRILYTIQAGDTCTKIQLLYNITFEQLRQLNQNINVDCTNLIPGQTLLVGTGGPAAAPTHTPGPSPTPAPPTVTPTPFAGTTEICVLLFNDINGNALRDAGENVILGGAISVTEITGQYSKTLETALNPDPTAYSGTCFTDVPEGRYNIGVAIPDNYSPTVNLTYTLDVKAGETDYVDFGAQSRESTVARPGGSDSGGGGTSPLLGFVGGILLLGGLGLGWYALRLRSPQGKFKGSSWLKR
jgi:murein DD-endopeptidase MepM/ murein hydrolase activator NlpD